MPDDVASLARRGYEEIELCEPSYHQRQLVIPLSFKPRWTDWHGRLRGTPLSNRLTHRVPGETRYVSGKALLLVSQDDVHHFCLIKLRRLLVKRVGHRL